MVSYRIVSYLQVVGSVAYMRCAGLQRLQASTCMTRVTSSARWHGSNFVQLAFDARFHAAMSIITDTGTTHVATTGVPHARCQRRTCTKWESVGRSRYGDAAVSRDIEPRFQLFSIEIRVLLNLVWRSAHRFWLIWLWKTAETYFFSQSKCPVTFNFLFLMFYGLQ